MDFEKGDVVININEVKAYAFDRLTEKCAESSAAETMEAIGCYYDIINYISEKEIKASGRS